MRYRITGNYPAPDFFGIHPVTGVVFVSRDLRLDSLQLSSYTLTVIASDAATPNLQGQASVFINVRRNENRPVFNQSDYNANINASQPQGVAIVQVTARDRDDRDTVYYTLAGNEKAQQFFYVDPRTGVVSLKASIQNDDTARYELLIQASDRPGAEDGQRSSTRVNVNVPRDVGAPVFQRPQARRINENAAVNSSVATFRANDPDLQGRVLYELVGDYPSQSFFWVDATTGVLFVRNSLQSDSLQSTEYGIRVAAYDSVHPTNRALQTLTVRVERNPSAPAFSRNSYSTRISENFPAGEEIPLDIKAEDEDGDRIRYMMVGDDAILRFFYLNPDDGTLTLRRSLDESTRTAFNLQIRASDGREPVEKTSTVGVRITINRDEQPPEWLAAPYRAELSENTPVNDTVIRVIASDSDLQGRLQYEIRGVAPGSDYFFMEKNTGTIKVARPLNDQTATSYILLVVVWDSGNPQIEVDTTVTITMRRNEFVPTFFPTRYEASISEHDPIGRNIVTVNATDQDLPVSTEYKD